MTAAENLTDRMGITLEDCIDLRDKRWKAYRVVEEETGRRVNNKTRAVDPWLLQIACQHGHICPWGGVLLAACTNTNTVIASRLRRLSFLKAVQDGDDGVNVIFQAEHFAEIAEIMRPKKRRVGPPQTVEQIAASIERLKAYAVQRKNGE